MAPNKLNLAFLKGAWLFKVRFGSFWPFWTSLALKI